MKRTILFCCLVTGCALSGFSQPTAQPVTQPTVQPAAQPPAPPTIQPTAQRARQQPVQPVIQQPAQSTITLGSLLHDMIDFATVARYPSPAYTLRAASSYDRRSVSPDQPGWFANSDNNQFIREEKKDGRNEQVMLDADGPGVIVRFWLTTVVKPGTLRFYFDNADTPSIVVPAFDLLRAGFRLGPGLLNPHSSYEPNGKGGNTLYLPLPYQQHCKITWQYADSGKGRSAHYYQVNYRTYTPGTKVETFTMGSLGKYRSQIKEAEAALWNPPPATGAQTPLPTQLLKAGAQTTFSLPAGSYAIRELAIRLNIPHPSDDTFHSSDEEKMWRNVIIKIEFDGTQTVFCPVGDFIGSGYGGRKISSWYRQLTAEGPTTTASTTTPPTTTNTATSRWVMPYQKKAVITFINKSGFDVTVGAGAVVSPFRWDNNTMYFHTTFKYEENVKDVKWDYDLTRVAKEDPAAPIDWNFATIKGKGIYMGNTLSVDNHMDAWYGEGDAKAYVDNETFPSEFGTGLEDYYNTSWAPVVLYQTPFANAPRADKPSSNGQNTFTRTRILDAIPFTKAFAFDMEMLSWKGGTIDAAATTYWYGLPGSRDSL